MNLIIIHSMFKIDKKNYLVVMKIIAPGGVYSNNIKYTREIEYL